MKVKGGLIGRERQTKSPSMSFDRNVGDTGLERRRGGHSCVPEPEWLGVEAGGGEVWSVYYARACGEFAES